MIFGPFLNALLKSVIGSVDNDNELVILKVLINDTLYRQRQMDLPSMNWHEHGKKWCAHLGILSQDLGTRSPSK